MNSTHDARATALDVRELSPDKCPAGPIATGLAVLATTPGLEVGVWEHPVGVSTDVEAEEVFVVLSGRGRVTCADGTVLDLQPGTVGVLEAGTRTTWEITEPLRKVWVVPA